MLKSPVWWRVLASLMFFVLIASACSSDGSDATNDAVPTDETAAEPTEPVEDEPDEDPEVDTGPVELAVIDGSAPYVSGGDMLVNYTGDPADLTIDGGELLVTPRSDDLYLVSGLPDGDSTLVGSGGVTLEVANYPITGPIFSGEQQQIYYTLESVGLTPTGDDACSAETELAYGYIDADGAFVEGSPPGDELAVRSERGTINRGIYQYVVADDSGGDEMIEPGKHVVYKFGGGCGTGHTQGGNLLPDVMDSVLLEAGYIVATSTFNVFQTHCNDVVSAETLMMVTERISEQVGPVGYVVGSGGSGGAIQQYLIAQNYPGLLDALSTAVSFPDASTIAGGVIDCGLLLNYYASEPGTRLSDEARLAINGHGSIEFCNSWQTTFVSNVDPSAGCDGAVPADAIYNAESNPAGIRCTLQDSGVNLFGVDDDGFGRRALDNVGVQYGLNALNSGVITVEEFLNLNERIGGYDIDGVIQPERTEAAPEVVELTYATGRVLHGDSALADVPVIDVDLYSDTASDIHDRFRLFTIRQRIKGNVDGPSANRVIWSRPGTGLLESLGTGNAQDVAAEDGSTVIPTETDKINSLVEWLEAGQRPDDVSDDCVIDGERIVGDDVFAGGQPCAEAYPYFGDPRIAAGAPLENDIIKCTLAPIDMATYDVEFSNVEQGLLETIFADGVCDYSLAGIGQVPLSRTWIAYD